MFGQLVCFLETLFFLVQVPCPPETLPSKLWDNVELVEIEAVEMTRRVGNNPKHLCSGRTCLGVTDLKRSSRTSMPAKTAWYKVQMDTVNSTDRLLIRVRRASYHASKRGSEG